MERLRDHAGKGSRRKKLGELLKEYGIRSEKIGFPGLGQTKGYRAPAASPDAWSDTRPT
ncbi:DUF3631 domain-containing protein [Pseudonocardia sp. Ae707_Ps2]|uniref:DUF3631 domain-containing protein n=1 Tax=Pseudonocardia sp. Ae707_Ps2 TaxID=2212992 RepID=UPI00307F65DD